MKHKKVCIALNSMKLLLILVSAVTVCVSISSFTFLVGITTSNTSPAVGLTIWAITTGIKKCKLMIKKKAKSMIKCRRS